MKGGTKDRLDIIGLESKELGNSINKIELVV